MLTPSTRLNDGRYVLTRFLRAGGAGVVWAARDARPRKGDSPDVAIKVLDAAAGGADAASREAEVAARVRHPNVVRVRDTFVHDGLACMVMDLARGSLADLVARVGPLPPPVALGCALQACEALAEAHRAGVVHRDVKPHNLLVFDDGSVRLADFGAARALVDGHTRTRTGALLGSIPFMAPEQRRDPRAVRPSTDVYALAVTLAWLLLGEAPDDPWTEEAAAQLRSAGVPEGLVRAVAIGGARRAEERPNDGAAFAEVLRGCGVVAVAGVEVGGEAWGASGEAAEGHGVGAGSGVDFWGGGPRPPATPPGASLAFRSRLRIAVTATLLTFAGAVGFWGYGVFHAPTQGERSTPESLARCEDAASRWVERIERGPRETLGAAVADVDGDDVLDVLFANNYSESTTIWWGESRALPSIRTEVPSGRHVEAPAVADVDAYGKYDIVVPLHNDASIAVVRGLGGRTFSEPQRFFQDPAPVRIASADLDADGGVDLAVVGKADGSVYLRNAVPTSSGWEPQVLLFPERGIGTTLVSGRANTFFIRTWSDATVETRSVYAVEGVRDLRSHTFSGAVLGIIEDVGDAHRFIARVRSGDDQLLVRVNPDDTMCLLGARGFDRRVHAAADLDQDGIIDLVETLTCQYCDSNHIFVRGTR